MSRTVLDQDFGSESEDDNFNPAPADESDHEGEADAEVTSKPTANGTERRRSSGADKGSLRSPREDANGEDEDHGDEDADGAGDEDEEDEEDEEDDEIIVRIRRGASICDI